MKVLFHVRKVSKGRGVVGGAATPWRVGPACLKSALARVRERLLKTRVAFSPHTRAREGSCAKKRRSLGKFEGPFPFQVIFTRIIQYKKPRLLFF